MTERTTKGRLVFHNGMPDCGVCLLHLAGKPTLIEACASVGLEHDKSTTEVFREYIASYHFGGHRGH